MNECVENTEPSKMKLEAVAGTENTKEPARASSMATNAVTVSATSTTVITSTSSSSTATTKESMPPAEALWNQFLKNISQESHSGRCKYPNPEVPEFYPRAANLSRAPATSSSTTITTTNSSSSRSNSKSSNNTVYKTPKQTDVVASGAQNVRFCKSELIKRITSDVTDLEVVRSAEKADPVQGALTRYYWSFHDVSSEYIPRSLSLANTGSGQLEYPAPAIECDGGRAKSAVATPSTIATKTVAELQAELATKNQQLAHLNHVVKALLEEIWKINELSTRHKNRDQWKSDLRFAIDEFLKPTTELGFHCDDCCDRLKDYVTRVSKQLEHKIAKQHVQYKNKFVDGVLSVVENSLRTLGASTNDDFKCTLLKHDVYTQTHSEFLDEAGTGGMAGGGAGCRRSSRMDAARRNKLQITKVYRNRNFYKCYDGPEVPSAAKEQWYANAPGRGEPPNGGGGGGRTMRFAAPSKSYAFQAAHPTYGDAQNPINPIQLIHQKYKNLNCRLEGIPDKNLVKFSYIVNGREYSAVASTKKEAQYHCAWHVLGATSQE